MMAATAARRRTEETGSEGIARNSSFYTAMRIMPPRERSAMYEIYAFCRVIDDIADEPGKFETKVEQLDQWRNNIALLYTTHVPRNLIGLGKAITDFGLRREDFLAVIDGMEMDVKGPVWMPDMATLTLYCDRVACAVGRLSVRVFGIKGQDGLDLAHHLGLALQFTNILRDVDEDAKIGRMYLPSELLETAGIRNAEPRKLLASSAVERTCGMLAEKALTHFKTADGIMNRCERKCSRTPRVMSQAYHAILSALMERGFASPRRPVRLSKIKLGYILARNILF